MPSENTSENYEILSTYPSGNLDKYLNFEIRTNIDNLINTII